LFSIQNLPLRKLFASGLLIAAMILAPALVPAALAHGGHQPPPADFSGKKVSLFVNLEPVVVANQNDPVYINARLFDENTNTNFKHVNYRIYFEKDGKEIPIITEGDSRIGGQGFFYDAEGDLQIKVVPTERANAVAKGEAEPFLGGIWNRGGPVVVEGPIFTEPGLYSLFVEIWTVDTPKTQVAEPLEYDVWVTPGREEMINVSEGGQTLEVKVRNYYGAIENSGFDPQNKTIQFSMPFDWTSDLPNRIGMLHTEVFIPKELADFDKDSLRGKVNGIDVPVFVVPTRVSGEDSAVVHFTVSQQNLNNIAEKIRSENRSPQDAVFSLSPPGPEGEIRLAQVSPESDNYKISLTWPEQIFPEQPVTFGVAIADKSGQPIPSATYELVVTDKAGNEVSRAGGVTSPEGISSQDVNFGSQGSFTVKVEKIRGSSESVESALTVVPEFPFGIAAIAAAITIGVIIAASRSSLFTGKTY
jgi:hypothetical protein